MKQHINDFLLYLRYEKGVSENTIEAYRSDIEQFLDFLGALALIPQNIAKFSVYLHNREYSPASISRKLSAIKNFCKYLYIFLQKIVVILFYTYCQMLPMNENKKLVGSFVL